MTRFSSDDLLPFPNLNDLNSCDALEIKTKQNQYGFLYFAWGIFIVHFKANCKVYTLEWKLRLMMINIANKVSAF